MCKFKYLVGYYFVICVIFLVTGCGHNMALTKGQLNVDTNKKSIGLLSVKVSNQYKPDYPLYLAGAIIVPKPAVQCKRMDDTVKNCYKPEAPYKSENGIKEYLLSFELEDGINNFFTLWVSVDAILFSGAIAHVPLNLEVNIQSACVTYLGHIDITLRKKNSDEEAAALFPLIDSFVVGFSTGTFDVVVEDRFEIDIENFYLEYPGMKKVIKIEKSILPSWAKAENKKNM